MNILAGMSNLLASLGHTVRRRVVLSHTLNTQTLMKTDEQKRKVLSRCMILCWGTFIAILAMGWTPVRDNVIGSLSYMFDSVILKNLLGKA